MRSVRRWPLTTFFLLAFIFTWALLPLARTSLVVSLVALCGPAAAALTTARLAGREQLRDLLTRMSRWRVGISWYLVALLLPILVSALRSGLEYVWGAEGPIRIQPVSVLSLIVFVLIAGEEIGWRGFALPRLLARVGPWTASVVIGLLCGFNSSVQCQPEAASRRTSRTRQSGCLLALHLALVPPING